MTLWAGQKTGLSRPNGKESEGARPLWTALTQQVLIIRKAGTLTARKHTRGTVVPCPTTWPTCLSADALNTGMNVIGRILSKKCGNPLRQRCSSHLRSILADQY